MNQPYDCLLMIALPADLEEEMLDVLRAQPQWVGGFSLMRAEGYGSGAPLRRSIERVRGRAERRLIQLLLERVHLEPLLETLQGSFNNTEIAWWTSPITGFGRFS